MEERQPESLVIGAGPAGLAVAACLRKCGVPFDIVEQANCLGASWRRYYDRLHLHTDKGHSALPYVDFPQATPRYPSRDEMIAYLERYAQHFGIAPYFEQRVESVRYVDRGWITTTQTVVYRSKRVIVATGYNAVPHLPGLERFLEEAPGATGLYFCGFRVSATGMLRDVGIEARRIAQDIARSQH